MPSIICSRLTTIRPSSSTRVGLGPHDHVVGTGHVVGGHHAGNVADVAATYAALPTSVWIST